MPRGGMRSGSWKQHSGVHRERVAARGKLAGDGVLSWDARLVPHVLEVRDFTVRRADGWSIGLPALTLARGGVAALHGPSGCGKTTLLEALFGLREQGLYATSGGVLIQGKPFGAMAPQQQRLLRRTDLAILVQGAHSALDPLQPVGRQVEQATSCNEAAVVS